MIDVNGNILQDNPITLMRTEASDVGLTDTSELLTFKEEISNSEKIVTETTLSSHNSKESMHTFVEQQIATTSSHQEIGSEGQNNLLPTESNQPVTEPVFKCKYHDKQNFLKQNYWLFQISFVSISNTQKSKVKFEQTCSLSYGFERK